MNLEPSGQLNLFSHKVEFHKLIDLYKDNNLPNKILFSGEKGIGKCTLAYHLVNYILSLNEDFSYDLNNLKIIPDNKSFKLVQNKSNPNFILVDIVEEKKNIDIGQIRNLILTLNKSSFNTKPRFILIDNIEQNLTVLAKRPDIFAQMAEFRKRLLDAIISGQPQKAWGASHRHLAFIEEVLLKMSQENSRMERSMRRMQRSEY